MFAFKTDIDSEATGEAWVDLIEAVGWKYNDEERTMVRLETLDEELMKEFHIENNNPMLVGKNHMPALVRTHKEHDSVMEKLALDQATFHACHYYLHTVNVVIDDFYFDLPERMNYVLHLTVAIRHHGLTDCVVKPNGETGHYEAYKYEVIA